MSLQRSASAGERFIDFTKDLVNEPLIVKSVQNLTPLIEKKTSDYEINLASRDNGPKGPTSAT
jgi:hypothetical protein